MRVRTNALRHFGKRAQVFFPVRSAKYLSRQSFTAIFESEIFIVLPAEKCVM